MRSRLSLTLRQIAEHVGGRLVDPADGQISIDRAYGLSDADEHCISYVEDASALAAVAAATPALALLVHESANTCARPAIAVRNPRLAFARVLRLLHPPRPTVPGIHPTAHIHPDAQIHPEAHVGPYCVVGAAARIGPGVILRAHVHVGRHSAVGAATELRPRVSIGDHVTIGAACLIHAGTIVGAADDAPVVSPVIIIGDSVELGGRAYIEAGETVATRIDGGTKTDNMTCVGAGAHVGPHCLMVSSSQVGAAAVLEHHCTLAGQAMVLPRGHVESTAIVAARGKVDTRVATRTLVSGDPAIPHKEELRRVANTMKLARLTDAMAAMMAKTEGDAAQ